MIRKCPNNCFSNSSKKKPLVKKMGSTLENQTREKFRDLPALSAIEGFLAQHSHHASIKRKRRVNEILFKLLSSGISMRMPL